MPTLAPDHTPNDVAYASRQGQPAPVSPAPAPEPTLADLIIAISALNTQLAAQTAEITNLKSQLAAQANENASHKSAIPQSGNPYSNNPQSAIRNPQSDNLHSPSPANPAFAPLYAREVKHYLPGGSWIMPPIPAAALTRQAHLQRLGYLSTRCELALIEKVDRFAVCGIVGAPERETYEFILHHLARLISIQKSLTALENDPTLPVGPIQDELTEVLTSIHRGPAASSATKSHSHSHSHSHSQSELVLSPSPSPSNSDQSDRSDQSDGSALPQSEISNPQSAIRNPQSAVPAVPAAPAVPDTQSVPVIREVPQCPTFSPERLVQTLVGTATELKVITPSPAPLGTPISRLASSPATANPQSSSPNAPSSASDLGPLTLDRSHNSHTSHTSHSSHSSHPSHPSHSSSPPSALHTPPLPDPPCPRAPQSPTPAQSPSNPQSAIRNPQSSAAPRPQCAECDAQLCPSRIAVPIFTGILKRTQKCDGACRFCSPKRQQTCPYTLPKFRDGPKK